jgi:hypothetical protein
MGCSAMTGEPPLPVLLHPAEAPAGTGPLPPLWWLDLHAAVLPGEAALASLIARHPQALWFVEVNAGTLAAALARFVPLFGASRLWLGLAAQSTDEAGEALGALAASPWRRRFLHIRGEGGIDLEGAGWRRCLRCGGAGARDIPGPEVCVLCPDCLGRGETTAPFLGALLFDHPAALPPHLAGISPPEISPLGISSADATGSPRVVFLPKAGEDDIFSSR